MEERPSPRRRHRRCDLFVLSFAQRQGRALVVLVGMCVYVRSDEAVVLLYFSAVQRAR